jgi:hypothetical protein
MQSVREFVEMVEKKSEQFITLRLLRHCAARCASYLARPADTESVSMLLTLELYCPRN